MSETKLLPCPFCGGSASIEHEGSVFRVQCECCLASTSTVTHSHMAVVAWNRRAASRQGASPKKEG